MSSGAALYMMATVSKTFADFYTRTESDMKSLSIVMLLAAGLALTGGCGTDEAQGGDTPGAVSSVTVGVEGMT